MRDRIDRAMKKVKLWQEECKLVVMFFGAVSAVAVFFSRIFHGKVGEGIAMKSMERNVSPESNMIMPELVSNLHTTDWVMIGSVVLFVIFLVMGIWLFVKVLKKHMNGHGVA